MNKKKIAAIIFLIMISFLSGSADAVWNVETVDSVGDVGWYTSIDIDSGGRPHISYYDYGNTDLKYARWTGSSWAIETVDTAGGLFTSIVLDNINYAHISYIVGSSVKCAERNGSSWNITTIGSADNRYKTSIGLDSNYYAHISYSYNSGLRHAYYNGTASWSTELVTTTGTPTDSSIVLAGNNPYIAYVGMYVAPAGGDVYMARWNGSSWLLDPPKLVEASSYWPSLQLDTSNNPHVSFQRFSGYDLRYAKWNGASCDNQLVDGSANNTGLWNCLALDSGNYAHISYHDNTNWDLKYATNKSGSWVIQTVDAIGGLGHCTSIKLDAGGNAHIAYYDITNKNLKYAKYTPGSYTVSGYIRDSGGSPLSGAGVYLSGADQSNYVTGSNGYFEFTDMPAKNYTVTPSLAGWSFSPHSRDYSPLGSSRTNQDFTGTVGVGGSFIRGYVTEPDGTPISDVLMSLQGTAVGSYTIGANGYYEFLNLAAGDYTLIPTKNSWVFIPETKDYSGLSSNQDSQNFLGIPTNTLSYIRGYIRDSSGKPIKDALINLSGAAAANYTSGEDGYYEFLNLAFGNYTVTPQLTGWNFNPVNRVYNNLYKNADLQNFSGVFGEIKINSDIKILGNLFNPNNGEITTIWYNIISSGKVTIKVYTIDGILVKELVNENKDAGTYTQTWAGVNNDGETVSSGIYIVFINAPGFRRTKKVCVLK